MILLTKNNIDPPVPYSNGDGSDPVTIGLTFDGSGTPVEIVSESNDPVYVWAKNDSGNIGSYSNIGIELLGSDLGITWELSTDNVNWFQTLSLGTLNVSASFQTIRLYARARAANDGSLITNNYTATRILLNATQNPL